MPTVLLRRASLDDAEAICAIYNQGIEDHIATLETARRTPEERRQWLAGRGTRHPIIVAEVRGQGIVVETGRFQQHMDVELVNDGPVTLLLDSRKAF